MDSVREKALQDFRKKLLEHKEVESRLKESKTFSSGLSNLLKNMYLQNIRDLTSSCTLLFHCPSILLLLCFSLSFLYS